MSETFHERAVAPLRAAALVVTAEPCPVCDRREARPRFAIEGLRERLVVCTGCGCGRLDPLPGDAELAAFYPDGYYGDPGQAKFSGPIEWAVRRLGARQARALIAGVPARGRVLDVGCGRGVLLRAFARAGYEAHGVEISAAAATGVEAFAELRIAPRLADAGYPDGFFDAVILWHVLEHLRDPRGAIAEAFRILRPQGRLVVAVPNFMSAQARWAGADWFHLDLPRHLHHFGLDGLERMLGRCGFESLAAHHFSLRQNPFGWIQSASNRFHSLPRNGLYALLHRRGAGVPAPLTPMLRTKLLGLGGALAPGAVVLSVLEAIARSGATVHVTARRPRA